MRKDFFLKGKKYKFFLGFHLFILGLYSVFMIIVLKSYSSSSDFKLYEGNISETIFKYSFYIIINLILSLILYFKIKYAKVILNLFAGVILVLVFYAVYTLSLGYINNFYYNFVISFNILIMGFILFYLSYLNTNNKEVKNHEIEDIGKHKE